LTYRTDGEHRWLASWTPRKGTEKELSVCIKNRTPEREAPDGQTIRTAIRAEGGRMS